MKQQVATITLNPAYDLIGLTDSIKQGDVNFVETAGLHAAGKGINVAKILKQLGLSVTAGGFLGKENQDGFQKTLQEFSIQNRFQLIEGRTRINVKLTERNNGLATDFNFSGFQVMPQDWALFSKNSLSWLNSFDIICISGSLPAGVSPDAFSQWMQQLCRQCPRVVFDSSRAAFAAGLTATPWLIKPNRHELEMWTGHSLPTLLDIQQAALQLQKYGISHIIISLGKEGAMWINNSGTWLAIPPECKIISTVGAGDSMVGGLIYGLLMNKSYEETFRLATAISALTVSQANVGFADQNELTQMMKYIQLTPFK